MPLSAVPESFLPYLEGEERCPAVRYGDGDSSTLALFLLVLLPLGGLLTFLGKARHATPASQPRQPASRGG
eukprot:SAG25_NODE_12130_length_287_cov_0.643617_1_plen_70_part_01